MNSSLTAKPADDLRRRVLDASLGLIAREGLEAFSMREVARRAGVSHQAPYHHFADREAIMAAIVTEGFVFLRADTLAAGEGAADPYERLSRIGKAYLAFAMRCPAHFKLMFRSEWVKAEKHDDASACAEGAFAVLADAIADVARAEGKAPNQTMLLIAWSLAHGLATLMLEGKLEKACGVEDDAQQAAANAVFDQFEAMMRALR
jgi:AcrR family transcriptional regulator